MSEEIKPITPNEALDQHEREIDPVLIKVVNEILKKGMSTQSSSVTFRQDTLLSAYKKAGGTLSRATLFKDKHLDFEDIYRKAGWKVIYDNPAYNETYEPTFTFSKK